MTHPRADNWLPRPDEFGPSAARRPETDMLSGRGFWWLWSLAIAAAGALITAWAEQWFQRGVPILVGVLGSFVIGAIEASLIQRRAGKHTGIASAPHLFLAGAGTVLSLALVLSAAMLPSIECAIAAVLCAASVGVLLARACQDCHPPNGTAPGRQHHA